MLFFEDIKSGRAAATSIFDSRRPLTESQRQPRLDNQNDITNNINVKAAKIAKLARSNPAGVRFSDLCKLAEAFGFKFQRQKGSHRVYAHDKIGQIMNFQNEHGMAKAYQTRQFLDCIDRHHLSLEEHEQD